VLRSNLSTRPFYNERVIHLLIALAGVIVLTITLFNLIKVVDLSRHNTELSTLIAHDRAEADRLVREAAGIRRGIDQKDLTAVAAAAREANTLIDQRTFSWTAFFNHLEATLPPDVMLVSVRPTVDNAKTRVSMTVLGRTAEDVDEFIEKLEATGDFDSVLARQTDHTEEGLERALLDAIYNPSHEGAPAEQDAPPVAKPEKPAGRPKGVPQKGASTSRAMAGSATAGGSS
jgi:hypothetical protein